MSAPKWSTPFCGAQHYTPLGNLSTGGWGTVTDRGWRVESTIYRPGSNANPETAVHPDAETARAHVERRLAVLMGVEVGP